MIQEEMPDEVSRQGSTRQDIVATVVIARSFD